MGHYYTTVAHANQRIAELEGLVKQYADAAVVSEESHRPHRKRISDLEAALESIVDLPRKQRTGKACFLIARAALATESETLTKGD